jgi:LysR family transcriptional regulator, nitrogen assimilation regulatory protein
MGDLTDITIGHVLDLRQLEYFLSVAGAGSFTRAAAQIGIAQPALSRHVRRLEGELGIDLFSRDGRGVSLTAAGKRLVDDAASILRQVDLAKTRVEELKSAPEGTVSIGMPATIAKLMIVPIVSEFQRRFPKAKISVIEGLSTYLKEFLVTGRVDIAILYDIQQSNAFDTFLLREEELYLICSARHNADDGPISLDEFCRFPLIISARPNAIRMRVEQELAKVGRSPNIALEINAIAPILELVAAGKGGTVLTKNALRAWSSLGQLKARPVEQLHLRTAVSMTVSKRGTVTPLQMATVNLLRDLGSEILG